MIRMKGVQLLPPQKMRILGDLIKDDVKEDPPEGLSETQLKNWYYQRYIKDYLRCVASVDDSVGQLLDFLQETEQWDNTIVIYTSDQGFFLGDHGWYDKRLMYEHSVRMPFLMHYPNELPAGEHRHNMMTNLDFALPCWTMQALTFRRKCKADQRALLLGETPSDWRDSMYYRYWDHGGHNVCSHYGIRRNDAKLLYFFSPEDDWRGNYQPEPRIEPYWEMYDLIKDPNELHNIAGDPEHAQLEADLRHELERLQQQYGDQALHLN